MLWFHLFKHFEPPKHPLPKLYHIQSFFASETVNFIVKVTVFLHYACELLRLERYSVAQVAELCNFSDIYFFSRQFKEYMGITPTQFVRKYRSSK